MLLDPAQTILDLDGEEIMADGKPMTLGLLVVTVLMAQFEGEERLSGSAKLDRLGLAEKFHGAAAPVEIDNAQAELILALAEKGLTVLPYGRVARSIKAAQSAMPAKANGKTFPGNGQVPPGHIEQALSS